MKSIFKSGKKSSSSDTAKTTKTTKATKPSKPTSSSGGSSKKKSGATTLHIVERKTNELHQAAKNDEFQRLKILIDANANIDVQDQDGASPLHLASYMGHSKIVELLIKSGAKIDGEDDEGATPLHNACIKKGKQQAEVVRLLLAAGANVNAKDQQGGTPLLNASCSGELEVTKQLLKKNADWKIPDCHGATPMHYACYNGHAPVVKALIEKGADITVTDNEGYTPLHHVCSQGSVPVLKALLKIKDININVTDKNKTTPLHLAAFNCHKGCVSAILQHARERFNVDIRDVVLEIKDKEGATPLHKAAFKGDQAVVQLFLDAGADINAVDDEGATVLHKAAYKGNSAIMNLLLERGAKTDIVDNQGGTALYNACFNGFVKCVQLLLEKSSDATAMINIPDKDGRGPLHAASCFGHWECTSLLVKHKAELNLKDKNNMTPLHLAAFMGCNLSMAYLANAGANASIPNNDGVTPIHYAAFKGHVLSVHLLCENAKDKLDDLISSTDNKGTTSIHYAASRDNWDVISYLQHRGAKIDRQNNEGLTPLSYAVKNFAIDAAVTLLENGADPDIKDSKGNTPRKLSKLRNNPIKKIFNAIGKRPFSPQTLAMLSDFKTPKARKKTERVYATGQTDKEGATIDEVIADKLGNISTPFTDFGFNFDLNDPAEVAEHAFTSAKKLGHHWTVLNCLRLLLIVPDDETNGRKMWILIEQFLHQLITNGITASTKLSFSEFLKECKFRREPPKMKKLTQLTGIENSFGVLFPSVPLLDESTDVTFIVDGMKGMMARHDADDGFNIPGAFGPGGQQTKTRIVKKVIVRQKKKRAPGATGDDSSSEDVEIEVDQAGNEIKKPSGGGGGFAKSRFHDSDSEDDVGDLDEVYKQFAAFDVGISWDEPAGGPSLGGGPPPPPPPPGMGGPPPPPPPPGMGGPPPPPPPGMPAKPKMKLRKLNWTKVPKPELATSIFRHLQTQGLKIDIPMLIEYFRIPDETKKDKKSQKKEEKKQLLDLKRANHIGLLISMLKMAPAEIAGHIINCKDDKFTEDNIKGFIKLLPGDSDLQLFKEFLEAPKNVLETLGIPEQFMIHIMRVPRLEGRLRAFLFKRQFTANVERLIEDVNHCHFGVKIMKENKLIGLFLELVLYLGNFLNQGTAAGNCLGYRLDILPKLKDTKSPTKTEYSLLHYIAQYAEKKKPKLCDLPSQLVPLSKSTAEHITSISMETAEMRAGLLNVQKELDAIKKANAQTEDKDKFESVFDKFFKSAEQAVGDLVTNVEALMADNKALYAYYVATKEMCLSTTFIQFARDFEVFFYAIFLFSFFILLIFFFLFSPHQRFALNKIVKEKKELPKLLRRRNVINSRINLPRVPQRRRTYSKKVMMRKMKNLEVDLKKLLKKSLKNLVKGLERKSLKRLLKNIPSPSKHSPAFLSVLFI